MPKKVCAECHEEYVCGGTGSTEANMSRYLPINNFLFDGYLPICNFCIEKRFNKIYTNNDYKEKVWVYINQFCQFLNIQFRPPLWEGLYKTHKNKTFFVYANMMKQTEYETPDWAALNKEYLELEKERLTEIVIPEIQEAYVKKLHEKWGMQYSVEDLSYLENLLNGIIKSQDVNGAKSYDEAMKLCKISLLIEERIRAGEDFDKLLGSYEKLTKVADFTPKNARNVNDFDSTGEVFDYLERLGWVNTFYDGATRDIVDTTMKNSQSWTRSLFVNDSTIPEEVERRLEALKHANELENQYYEDPSLDYDKYEKEAYDQKEEFSAEI